MSLKQCSHTNRPAAFQAARMSSPSTQSCIDRRTALLLTSSLVTSFLSGPASSADPSSSSSQQQRGLARYVKRKALDPLESYIPLVLRAREQLQASGEIMLEDQQAARSLLRKGAFSGLRENIRAIGEYAAKSSDERQAALLVNGVFLSLDAYDQVLLAGIRGAALDQSEASRRLQAVVKAVDELLATVPEGIITQSQSVLDVTKLKSQSVGDTGEDDRVLRSLLGMPATQ